MVHIMRAAVLSIISNVDSGHASNSTRLYQQIDGGMGEWKKWEYNRVSIARNLHALIATSSSLESICRSSFCLKLLFYTIGIPLNLTHDYKICRAIVYTSIFLNLRFLVVFSGTKCK